MRIWATVLVTISSLGLTGCFTAAAKKQLVLPPAPVVAAKPAPPEPQFVPVPEIVSQAEEIPGPALVALEADPQMDTPPPKPTPKRRPVPATPVPAASNPPAAPEPETPAAPPVVTAPLLSEILTEDRRKQYETDFNASVGRAHAAVTRTNGRPLNPHQQETVQRINTFLQQAEESKGKDLVTALQLARRADLLGQDLLKSLQ